jgi:hypothetical protein
MLSISDWISFLTSEKNPNIGNLVGFMAVIVAAFAVVTSLPSKTVLDAINVALIGVALILACLAVSRYYGGRANIAGQLLNEIVSRNERIMSGNEIDPSKIAERWDDLKGKRKNK